MGAPHLRHPARSAARARSAIGYTRGRPLVRRHPVNPPGPEGSKGKQALAGARGVLTSSSSGGAVCSGGRPAGSTAPRSPPAVVGQGHTSAASTSSRRPVARSRTNPRTASVRGMKGEALMWAIDWRTLSARSVKAPGAQVGRAPV